MSVPRTLQQSTSGASPRIHRTHPPCLSSGDAMHPTLPALPRAPAWLLAGGRAPSCSPRRGGRGGRGAVEAAAARADRSAARAALARQGRRPGPGAAPAAQRMCRRAGWLPGARGPVGSPASRRRCVGGAPHFPPHAAPLTVGCGRMCQLICIPEVIRASQPAARPGRRRIDRAAGRPEPAIPSSLWTEAFSHCMAATRVGSWLSD